MFSGVCSSPEKSNYSLEQLWMAGDVFIEKGSSKTNGEGKMPDKCSLRNIYSVLDKGAVCVVINI